ncbi:probable histone H2B 4 [Ochlerotatus camptorhynchus]|uniref:probable histone H2B 4 n=1 Tax=Ochlerotatus camptorhynchus TaxID=644619 RepID=UPI0031E012B2
MVPKSSGKAAKKSGKAQKVIVKGEKKKKRQRRKESYAIYIYKVLKHLRTRPVWLNTSNARRSRPAKSKLRSVCCCRPTDSFSPIATEQRSSSSFGNYHGRLLGA